MGSNLLGREFMARGEDDIALTKDDQTRLSAEIPEWDIASEGEADKLVRMYRFKNFAAALDFTNRIGTLAEEVDHHPIIMLQWGKVGLEWWTHEIGGLHYNDFVMAARSDLVYDEMRV